MNYINCVDDASFDKINEQNLIEKSQKIFCDNYKINSNEVDSIITNVKINETHDLFLKPRNDRYIYSCFWVKSKCNGFFVFTELNKNDYIYKNFENNNIIICFNFIDTPIFFNNTFFFKFISEENDISTELIIIDFYNKNDKNIKKTKNTMSSIKIQMEESKLDYHFFNLLLYSNSSEKIKELVENFDKTQNYNLFFYNKINLLNDNIDEINKGVSSINRFNQRFYYNNFIDQHISNWIHDSFKNINSEQTIISPHQHDSIFNFFFSIFENILSTIQTHYFTTESIKFDIIELVFTKHIENLKNQISTDSFFFIILISVYNPNSEKIVFNDGMSYNFNKGDMLIINKNDNYCFCEKTNVEYIKLFIDLNKE